MGCRSGITRRTQSSMSAWVSDGTGGFRVEAGLRDFAMARSPIGPGSVQSILAPERGGSDPSEAARGYCCVAFLGLAVRAPAFTAAIYLLGAQQDLYWLATVRAPTWRSRPVPRCSRTGSW